MNGKTPHLVQYQGSKRILAPQILQYMPEHFHRLVEPFAGMAAISIAVAMEHRANQFLINDINQPLVNVLRSAIDTPDKLINDYSKIWNEQFEYSEGHIQHFYKLREDYNY